MCGILGAFGSSPNLNWATNQVSKLSHRGPDHQQVIQFNPQVVMGAARLSMTDPLPRSNQPFLRKDLEAVITFNGEIYNYQTLRGKLEKSGYSFQTSSDTEVLLAACHKYGHEVTSHLNGMYSFAYYNLKSNQMMLARDSLGKKPLFWSVAENTIYWSSSLKQVATAVDRFSLSQEAMACYFALGYTVDPQTIYEDIFAVPPGKILLLGFSIDDKLKIDTYSAPEYLPSHDFELGSLDSEIRQAVRHRITGHENVAISLSGGLDSTIIAMIAAETNSNVFGYSAEWSDSDKTRYNLDSQFAKAIAKNLGIKFKKIEMPKASNISDSIDEMVNAMEEPNSNPTGISMMNLYSGIAKDQHRLVLTGDGADEIFAGYPRYEKSQLLPRFGKLHGQSIDNILNMESGRALGVFRKILLSQTRPESLQNWAYWHWNFPPAQLAALIDSDFKSADHWYEISRALIPYSKNLAAGSIENLLYLDRAIWLSMESNRKLDRISMHYSIEARSPFQDDRVIKAGLREMQKENFKAFNKKLLWSAFPEVKKIGVRQDKTGFISPVGHWLRTNPKLVKESISHLSTTGYFSHDALNSYSEAANSGNYRRIMQLWSLVVFSRWLGSSATQ